MANASLDFHRSADLANDRREPTRRSQQVHAIEYEQTPLPNQLIEAASQQGAAAVVVCFKHAMYNECPGKNGMCPNNQSHDPQLCRLFWLRKMTDYSRSSFANTEWLAKDQSVLRSRPNPAPVPTVRANEQQMPHQPAQFDIEEAGDTHFDTSVSSMPPSKVPFSRSDSLGPPKVT